MSRATARSTPYLLCRRARGGIMNYQNAVTPSGQTSGRSKERARSCCLSLEGPLVIVAARQSSCGNQRGGTKMAASSIHCIVAVCRGHIDGMRKLTTPSRLS
ncbi:hypothetical protein N9L68_09280 [bacterium]|nr:hypothetical protein [bacterium]